MENLPTNSQHHPKSLQLNNAFYALVSVVSQTGQIATLPLWIDSGLPSNATISNSTDGFRPFMDETFVTIFTGFFLVVVYGVILSIKAFISGKNGQRFNFKVIPLRQLVLTSLCGAVAAILTMFSASGKRTAPYLQAILLNITIPATVVLRYCILKKSPTRKKLICATVTVLSLFVCLLPSIIPKIDPKSNQGNVQGGAKGFAKVIWPLIFIIAFIFQALTSITSEKLLQSTRSLTVVSVLFLMQCLMFVFTLSSIFLDALPFFGNVDNLDKVALNLSFGVRCFFGKGGCSFYPALYGTLFLLCTSGFALGSSCLLRYSEGATYMAVVLTVTTPLGFFFWTLFKEQPTLHWDPQRNATTWLNIIGLVFMVPAIYIYNMEDKAQIPERRNDDQQDMDTIPLLNGSSSEDIS